MMRWLEGNPLATALAAGCGVLVLMSVGLAVFSALPVGGAPDGAGAEGAEGPPELPSLAEAQPLDAFAVITQRPVFNASRQLEIGADDGSDALAEAMDGEQASPLEVQLSGVVITPTLKMVTLRRADGSQSLVAFEGQPIEGEFSSWQVSRVEPRNVVLTSGTGEELQLELKVHDQKIQEPARPEPRADPGQEAEAVAEDSGTAPASGPVDPATRAEEIRQRIAERREELRRQAEMEEEAAQEQSAPNYQDSIRTMMTRRRNQPNEKQDDQ